MHTSITIVDDRIVGGCLQSHGPDSLFTLTGGLLYQVINKSSLRRKTSNRDSALPQCALR